MIEHATFDDETVILQPGDRLYFYTDGVIEALDASEQEFGYVRLMAEVDRLRDRPLREGLDHRREPRPGLVGGPPAGRRVAARGRADGLKTHQQLRPSSTSSRSFAV